MAWRNSLHGKEVQYDENYLYVGGDYANSLAVAAGSTSETIPNHGLTTLSSTQAGKAYTMAAPAPRTMAILACLQGSSVNTNVVTLESGTFDGTNDTATFNASGENLALIGVSTSRYAIIGNIGSVALS